MNGCVLRKTLLVPLAAILLLAVAAHGLESEYKPFRRSVRTVPLFEIAFNQKQITFSVTEGEREIRNTFALSDLERRPDGSVAASGEVVADQTGIVVEGLRRDWKDVVDMMCIDNGEDISITFLARSDTTKRSTRMRLGNEFSFADPVTIDEDIFIRGFVLTVTGDIEVYGEVNKDVVSLFGNVYIGPAAVARGDVATIDGRIDAARDASIYGELYSSEGARTKKHRFARCCEETDDLFALRYNRVDGLYLQEGVRYQDPDSVLPSLHASVGFAFAPERWRFDLGLEQTILKSFPLAIGGNYYRKLASEDDWMVSDRENTIFAVLAREDFKDYYEVEGAYAGLTVRPLSPVTLKGGVYSEETKWLPAHRFLWSVFGGDKLSDPNFWTVDSAFRSDGIDALNNLTNAGLRFSLAFDTRSRETVFGRSSWHASADLEWSHPDLDSDYDYKSYRLAVRRYQKLHRRAWLVGRAIYAGSEGDLPMHKRYFLGGIGSLRGYSQKEFMGTEYWMANFEYVQGFRRSDLAAVLFYDVGQIANEVPLDDDVEVKHSIGVGLAIGDHVRIEVARRLDGREVNGDGDGRIWVRLEHTF